MNEAMLHEEAISMEKKMSEAFSSGDSAAFGKLVSPDALMICGGYKDSGAAYTSIVAQIKIEDYELNEFETRVLGPNAVLTNYRVKVQCEDASISGLFRVSSIWSKEGADWKLIFNQDSRLYAAP